MFCQNFFRARRNHEKGYSKLADFKGNLKDYEKGKPRSKDKKTSSGARSFACFRSNIHMGTLHGGGAVHCNRVPYHVKMRADSETKKKKKTKKQTN